MILVAFRLDSQVTDQPLAAHFLERDDHLTGSTRQSHDGDVFIQLCLGSELQVLSTISDRSLCQLCKVASRQLAESLAKFRSGDFKHLASHTRVPRDEKFPHASHQVHQLCDGFCGGDAVLLLSDQNVVDDPFSSVGVSDKQVPELLR